MSTLLGKDDILVKPLKDCLRSYPYEGRGDLVHDVYLAAIDVNKAADHCFDVFRREMGSGNCFSRAHGGRSIRTFGGADQLGGPFRTREKVRLFLDVVGFLIIAIEWHQEFVRDKQKRLDQLQAAYERAAAEAREKNLLVPRTLKLSATAMLPLRDQRRDASGS
jgi:hypothetical protein